MADRTAGHVPWSLHTEDSRNMDMGSSQVILLVEATFSLVFKKKIFEGINSSIFGKTLIPVTCFAVYFFFNLKNYCFVSKRQKKYLVEVKLLQSHWP